MLLTLRQECSMNQSQKGANYWIRIVTNNPDYVYYFGSFESYEEAQCCVRGYIQDLKEEGSKIVFFDITRYQPKQLNLSLMPFSA